MAFDIVKTDLKFNIYRKITKHFNEGFIPMYKIRVKIY